MASFIALLCACAVAGAADDLKVSQLEQDVRDLQRPVQALTRQLESQRPVAPQASGPSARARDAAAPAAVPAWVDAAKWVRIQPGMDELGVIAILGAPTALRQQAGGTVLLYALEIGSSGFLGGSVTLRDRRVVAVQKPALQ